MIQGSAKKRGSTEKTLARILDAALSCYTECGINQTSLEQVARAAGVGRTTIYRYVDNREDLLDKVLQRDAQQQVEEMRVLLESHDDLSQGLIDTIVYVMRGRRTRPINAVLFAESGDLPASGANLSPARFYSMTEGLMTGLFAQAEAAGRIREGVTLPMASRWVARIVLSLINYPDEFLQDESALREFLQRFLIASLLKDPV